MTMTTTRAAERPSSALAHEPALDGMRGLAMVLIFFYHGGLGPDGGALAIDLFFVLSGFLITSLLLAELEQRGSVDLVAFWGRRARRLLPALFVLVLVVVLHAAITGDGGIDALRLDALATLGYVSNWRFIGAANGGYFDAFATPSPLRHTWSLAVEEQWYFLFPPALLLLWRTLRSRLLPLTAVLGGLAVASASLTWLLRDDLDRVHYGTDARAQSLLVGAALATFLGQRPVRSWSRANRSWLGLGGWIAAAAVTWMLVAISETTPWLPKGGHLLLALATAVVLAAALLPTSGLRRALSVRPLRWIGTISYGLYLWHWPVFVWLTPVRTGLGVWPLLAARTAVSISLAVLSARLIERPVREGRLHIARPGLTAFGATAICVMLVVGIAAVAPHRDGSALLAAEASLPVAYRPPGPDDAAELGEAEAASSSQLPPVALRADDGSLDVAVIGDSTGWTLAFEFDDTEGIEVTRGGLLGCGIDPAAVVIEGRATTVDGTTVPCHEAPHFWRQVLEVSQPDVVLLTEGAWEVFDRRLPDGTELEVGSDAWAVWLTERLNVLSSNVVDAAPQAWLAMTDVPCFTEQASWLGGPASARNDLDRVAAVNRVFAEFAARNPERVVLLPLSDWICPDGATEGAIDGIKLRNDGVHFTHEGANVLWTRYLTPQLEQLVAADPRGCDDRELSADPEAAGAAARHRCRSSSVGRHAPT